MKAQAPGGVHRHSAAIAPVDLTRESRYSRPVMTIELSELKNRCTALEERLTAFGRYL
jgi:hypothetical protein